MTIKMLQEPYFRDCYRNRIFLKKAIFIWKI